MGVEDKRLGRLLMHELYRFQSLDMNDVTVNVVHAVGYVGGTIRPAAGLSGLNMKEEMRIVDESLRRLSNFRGIIIDAKIEQSSKK